MLLLRSNSGKVSGTRQPRQPRNISLPSDMPLPTVIPARHRSTVTNCLPLAASRGKKRVRRDTIFKLNHALTIRIFPNNITIEDTVVIGNMGGRPQGTAVTV